MPHPHRPPVAAVLAVLLVAATASAQESKPPLRWGGDKNGGAPYIFEEGGQLTGFEVEFAEYLGKELGRTPVFVQNQWDNLPDSLKRGDIDVVLNGYEFSPERHADTPTTVPYYVYSLRLVVRADEKAVQSWADLGRAVPPRRVGVLRGSAAERYLPARFGDKVTLQSSETVTEMLDLVRDGRADVADCTVQDAPAAAYYLGSGRYPTLKAVDDPAGYGYYVMLTRPGDGRLRDELSAAVRKAVRSGKLRELYAKYQIWNAAQQRLSYLADQPWPGAADELDAAAEYKPQAPPTLWGIRDRFLEATAYTLLLAFASFPIAMGLGLGVALGRVYGPWVVRAPLAVYVEILRGTPLLLQLYVIFYLLPQLGELSGVGWLRDALTLNKFVAAVLGLALNYSANEAENYRAGLLAVPRGQMEAALALGLTPVAALRRVVIPQAVRIVVPPVTNDFIALFKDTAVCSTIMIVELTGLYYQFKIYPSLVLELAVAVGLLYLLMSYPMAVLARRLERRLSPAGKGGRA